VDNVPSPRADEEADQLPDYRLRLLFAVVLGSTLFGSLAAMLHGGDRRAATAVALGLAVSLLPILLRVLPPLGGSGSTSEQSADFAVTITGLVLYVIVTGGTVFLLNV
jgi:hypothetical protein